MGWPRTALPRRSPDLPGMASCSLPAWTSSSRIRPKPARTGRIQATPAEHRSELERSRPDIGEVRPSSAPIWASGQCRATSWIGILGTPRAGASWKTPETHRKTMYDPLRVQDMSRSMGGGENWASDASLRDGVLAARRRAYRGTALALHRYCTSTTPGLHWYRTTPTGTTLVQILEYMYTVLAMLCAHSAAPTQYQVSIPVYSHTAVPISDQSIPILR